ncbi:MAG: hypothetical protein AB7S75_12415 [Desulfococcaceae bacterium]
MIPEDNVSPEDERSNARLAVAELLTGLPLKSRDISEILSRKTGREISIGSVSRILFRITDPEKCDLGHFISKSREGNALVYTLVREAASLSESKAYDLTLKKGAGRYTLAQALADYPGLRKYTDPSQSVRPVFRMMKKPVDKSLQTGIMHVGKSAEHAGRTMEFSLRYSDRYTLSVTASFGTFVLICCVLWLVFALCCFAVYTFVMPILLTIVLIAVLCGIGFFLQKKYAGKG